MLEDAFAGGSCRGEWRPPRRISKATRAVHAAAGAPRVPRDRAVRERRRGVVPAVRAAAASTAGWISVKSPSPEGSTIRGAGAICAGFQEAVTQGDGEEAASEVPREGGCQTRHWHHLRGGETMMVIPPVQAMAALCSRRQQPSELRQLSQSPRILGTYLALIVDQSEFPLTIEGGCRGRK